MISRFPWGRCAFLAVLLVLGAAAVGGTQEEAARPAAVLGLVRPTAGADGDLQSVLASALAVKLQRWGLEPIPGEAADLGALDGAPGDTRALFALARRVRADFVLEGVYSSSREEIEIDLVWYDVQRQEAAASVSERGRLDLTLDAVISQALADILGQVGEDLSRYGSLPPAVAAAPAAAPLQASPASAGAMGGLPPRPSLSPQESLPPHRPELKPADPELPGQGSHPEAMEKPRKRLELATSGAAFIATGRVSEYFKVGYGSALHLDLLFGSGSGRLGAGLYAAVNYFRAEGVAAAASSFLVPLGVDLRYLVESGLPLAPYAYVSAGPAMLVVLSEHMGDQSKLVPYALAGLGVQLPLSPSLGAALDLSYSTYFESSLLIMAFVPSVSLYLRL